MGLHKEGEIIMASPGKRRRKKMSDQVAPEVAPVVEVVAPAPAPKKKEEEDNLFWNLIKNDK